MTNETAGTEAVFLADLAEARRDAKRLAQEVRMLRKAKAGRGAIAGVRWALAATEAWLWQVRFAAWSAEQGTADEEAAARAEARRDLPVPF